jgi:hypothetical protein
VRAEPVSGSGAKGRSGGDRRGNVRLGEGEAAAAGESVDPAR